MQRINKAWFAVVSWFEYGDLVPLIVIISAVHYASMLSEHDHWFVAICIGALVDLGHYRTVRAAVRYTGGVNRHSFTRWTMALMMSSVAVAYQQRYYDDWWLSLPLPFLVAALAWLNRVDKGVTGTTIKTIKEDKPSVKTVTADSQPVPQMTDEEKQMADALVMDVTAWVSRWGLSESTYARRRREAKKAKTNGKVTA